jgi:hypothetical protein
MDESVRHSCRWGGEMKALSSFQPSAAKMGLGGEALPGDPVPVNPALHVRTRRRVGFDEGCKMPQGQKRTDVAASSKL